MSVLVRPMRPDDVAAAHASSFATFAELDSRTGDPVPEHTEATRVRGETRVAHLLRTDPGGAWAAELDGRLVGVGLALRRGPLWFLSLLTVEPGLQGQGTGKRLLDATLTTAEDAPMALIMASNDPKALRRYAAAGFSLHPGYDAHGTPDRSSLPAGLDVREQDLATAGDLVDDLVTLLRGAGYGPDLDAFAAVGAHALLAEDGDDRGFALVGNGRVLSVGATRADLATRLLQAGLGTAEGDVTLSFLTADQQWAIDVALAARLEVKPGSSSCRRGRLGPLSPYLPSGAYG